MDVKAIEPPGVREKFLSYPDVVRQKLLSLRGLILKTAAAIDEVGALKETLKWGEPSYVSGIGSTVRIDWKEKTPQQYAMYFHCGTKLVATFRELYRDELRFEGNRAIILGLDEAADEDVLRHCITLALRYHKLKHLPLLGA